MIAGKIQKIICNIVIIYLLIGGVTYVCSRFICLENTGYTDNAQVKQHITPISTRVPGFIGKVYFGEYQQARKGDVLLIIRDAEFRLHVAQAEVDLTNAAAGHRATTTGIATTQNNLSVSDANIGEVRVQMENAKRELNRFEKLLWGDAVTKQQHDNVHAAYKAAKTRYEQVSRAKMSTSLVRGRQTHRLGQNEAGVRLAEAALELARLNLSCTITIAPCDGTAGKEEIPEGQLVQPGQTMVNIVNSSDLWVIINYRETQLPDIKEDTEVEITADAAPDIIFKGVVESISDATGAAFLMIPQDNATGSSVKMEQCIPACINLKGNKLGDLKRVRAGFNVECEVKY